ncbi:MAG: hypothetical protein MUF77_13010 [Leptospira sp.]|jgi:hypothetical protein|nr:hypothetical protein [Leptospira sp.]
MLRYLFDLSKTEILVFALLAVAGFFLFVFSKLKKKDSRQKQTTDLSKEDPSKSDKNQSSKNQKKSGSDPNLQVMEIFDYNGTKILHQDGAYTVNDKGVVTNYMNWNLLPPKYQLMVKELDKRSLGEKGQDYFLEMINGFYFVSLPGGKKKRYDSIQDIPPEIRKKVGV